MKINNGHKIFEGEDSIKNYLDPVSMGPTPLVELPSRLNKFKKDKIKIYIKLLEFVPLANVKSLPSWSMLSHLSKDTISKTTNLVEYSSGNTVFSLTILARHFGIRNMNAVITPDVPENKKNILKLIGAQLLISHGPKSPDVFSNEGGVYEAKKMGEKKGWLNMNQYTNLDNPRASSKYVGEELWMQLKEKLTIFVSSVGTSGTIYGAGKYLKSKNKDIYVVGASIKKGSEIPGPRGEENLHKLAFPWKTVVDKTIPIDRVRAYKSSLDLIREGLLVGPSTGMQLALINKMILSMKKNKTLNKYRNNKGEIIIAFIAGDTMYPYVDEYFNVLPKKYFKDEINVNKILK